MRENISLIGYRGSGKSTLGMKLAHYLGWNFIDIDTEIQNVTHQTITQIFQTEGDAGFRTIESQILYQIMPSTEHAVIAHGGGIILSEVNRLIIQENSFVIYLETPEDELWERIKESDRPKLTHLPLQKEISAVLSVRHPLYLLSAHLVVSMENNYIDQALNLMITALRENGPEWIQTYI